MSGTNFVQGGGAVKIFLIVLLACADWSKIFFQVFLKDGNFYIYISRNETVSVPAALKVYLYITIGNFWSLVCTG